ncbi:MAG: hypothetical protein EPN43_10015 [Jatrophihabitans sp.]|nr:MAG: hypothetical protein EPN43_10015 [Jatrophihabitans sp.]
MTGTVRIVRETGMGFELRRAAIRIHLDGADVGTVAPHGTVETAVGAGRHTLRLTAGRYSSPTRTFELADGSAATFRCHAAALWPRYVASLLKPDLGIALKQEL